jgi:hypothetical protein
VGAAIDRIARQRNLVNALREKVEAQEDEIRELRRRRDLIRWGMITDILSLTPRRPLHELYIVASGTETYYGLVSRLLSDRVLLTGARIHLAFRVGESNPRHHKLTEYSEKWKNLALRYQLVVTYHHFDDFLFCLRGVVVPGLIGYIGFYHRVHGETLGSDQQVLVVTEESELGEYLLEGFLRIFDCVPPAESMLTAAKVEGTHENLP